MSDPKPLSLPPPLDACSRRVLTRQLPPEKPTDHGCGYFDDGCPWNICYACEYERDPAAYTERVRKSNLVQLVTAYFRNVRAGEAAQRYTADTLAAVIAELDTETDKRRFTGAEVAAGALVTTAPEHRLTLHALNALLPHNQR
jgi:hypothetical protein